MHSLGTVFLPPLALTPTTALRPRCGAVGSCQRSAATVILVVPLQLIFRCYSLLTARTYGDNVSECALSQKPKTARNTRDTSGTTENSEDTAACRVLLHKEVHLGPSQAWHEESPSIGHTDATSVDKALGYILGLGCGLPNAETAGVLEQRSNLRVGCRAPWCNSVSYHEIKFPCTNQASNGFESSNTC